MIGTTDRMQVDYAQYYLYGSNYVEGEDHDAFQRIWTGNSVAAAAPDYLAVSCGTLAGYIRLTVEGRMDPPGPPGADWETVVDLSLYSLTGELGVQPWGARPRTTRSVETWRSPVRAGTASGWRHAAATRDTHSMSPTPGSRNIA